MFVAEAREGLGGEALDPGVRVLERGAQTRQCGGRSRTQPAERLDRAIAGVTLLAVHHGEQGRAEVTAAFADGFRRVITHGGRPAFQTFNELLILPFEIAVVRAFGEPVAAGDDDFFHGFGIQRGGRGGFFADDAEVFLIESER